MPWSSRGERRRRAIREKRWRWVFGRTHWLARAINSQTGMAVITPRAERSELNVRLRTAIETLTDTQREVLMMHDVEGWKHADIASLLGLAESTVRVHLLHARRRLRTQLVAVAAESGPGEAVR